MMKQSILFILLCGYFFTAAQMPGGVDGAMHWYSTTFVSDENSLTDRIQFNIKYDQLNPTKTWKNYNPVFSIDKESGGITFDLKNKPLTIFSVTQCQANEEEVVYDIVGNQKSEIVLTNYRLADLSSYNYMNFIDKKPNELFLSTYIAEQSRVIRDDEHYTLVLGQSLNDKVPAPAMQGHIGEIILYDRILTQEERRRIESMLAIKYAINIATFQNPYYLNAIGEVIWDGATYENYNHDIIGLGRDDSSGLNQRQAELINKNGAVSIALDAFALTNNKNNGSLENNSFLLFGHNNENFILDKSDQNYSAFLRKYIVQFHNWTNQTPNQLKLNLADSKPYINSDEFLYLVVDQSGSNRFSPLDVTYYKSEKESDYFLFNDVDWDKNNLGIDGFQFVLAPNCFIHSHIESFPCEDGSNARLTWQHIGGYPPYAVQILGPDMDEVLVMETDAATGELHLSAVGMYAIHITDSKGTIVKDDVLFTGPTPSESHFPTSITLKHNESMTIDPSEYGIDQSIWVLPDGSKQTNSELIINQQGQYILIDQSTPCAYAYVLEVERASDLNFTYRVYNNPTTDGSFSIQIDCEENQTVNYHLLSPQGKLIKSETLKGRSQYFISEGLPRAKGNYFMTLIVGEQELSIPLIHI